MSRKTSPLPVISDLNDYAQTEAAVHTTAFFLFQEEMRGRSYGREELTDAWAWFLAGWKAGCVR
jgi:hypothetical protein